MLAVCYTSTQFQPIIDGCSSARLIVSPKNSGISADRVDSMYSALSGVYDHRLVTLSVILAILPAYAALDLAGRATAARGWRRRAWLGCAALAMGSGIWAMHYVALEALRLPVPVDYDWPTVLFSLLVAIAASFLALSFVSRPEIGRSTAIAGSVCMGAGIAATYYIAVDAMRLPATSVYSPGLVA